jgi:hypothetical protein
MDSPFTSRLDSNYVASDSESLEIQEILKNPTLRVAELTSQLQQLDEQHTQLRNEQSALLLFISKHRALISLIRKLPIDILQEIFFACIPTTYNAVMSRWEPPILLTHICSSWRYIAHATPQLWKSIHIAVPSSTPGRYPSDYATSIEHIHRRSDAVLEWLSRSAGHPLDISLGNWGSIVPDVFYDKIISSLIRFSDRWSYVRLSAPHQALVPVANLPPSKVPLLESLSLDFPSVEPPVDYQVVWITGGLLKSPKLHDLCIRGLWLDSNHLDDYMTRLPVNWSQLTNFSLEGTSWGSFSISKAYTLFSLCPNLITCRLEIGDRGDFSGFMDDLSFRSTISLPFLKTLSIREEITSLSRLFNLLHLPSIHRIQFHTTIRPTPSQQQQQQQQSSLFYLLTPPHNVIELVTDPQYFTRQEFIQCLRLCPLLRTLSIRRDTIGVATPIISSCSIDNDFLNMFTNDNEEGGGYLCPHLKAFECSSETLFSESALLQFVKAKNGENPTSTSTTTISTSTSTSTTTGLAKLTHLFVVFYCRPLTDDIDILNQELEPYEEAGLLATITYPHTAPFSAFGGLPGFSPPY